MKNEDYTEDDLLSSFGEYLEEHHFLILALGGIQGRYWYDIDNGRKAPDLIAIRHDIVLVGEAKVKSRELFKSVRNRKSDYQCLQYLLDNNFAKEQLYNTINLSVIRLDKEFGNMPPIQAIVVGGDSFATLQDDMVDNRIWSFTVDRITENVTPDRFAN